MVKKNETTQENQAVNLNFKAPIVLTIVIGAVTVTSTLLGIFYKLSSQINDLQKDITIVKNDFQSFKETTTTQYKEVLSQNKDLVDKLNKNASELEILQYKSNLAKQF